VFWEGEISQKEGSGEDLPVIRIFPGVDDSKRRSYLN